MQLMTSLRLPLVFGVAFLGIFSALTARGDTTYVVRQEFTESGHKTIVQLVNVKR